jgi:hypothetical protein
MRFPPATLFAVLAGLATLAGIVAGFLVIGPPAEVRMRRFDETRAGDLGAISDAVAAYRRTHQGLPEKLDDLARSSEVYRRYSLKDPAGRPYDYTAKDAFSYELCAEFDRATDDAMETRHYPSIFWRHGQGRQCFSLEARPPVHQ